VDLRGGAIGPPTARYAVIETVEQDNPQCCEISLVGS
jgi:hypothetical protein